MIGICYTTWRPITKCTQIPQNVIMSAKPGKKNVKLSRLHASRDLSVIDLIEKYILYMRGKSYSGAQLE